MAIRRRLYAVTGTAILSAGLAAGAAVALPGAASAAACSGTTPITDNCTITSTADLGAGTLQLYPPNALTWAATLNGAQQLVADATDVGIAVSDLSGTGGGWNVTASPTQFSDGTNTLPTTGTLTVNGSTTAGATSTTPAVSCLVAQGGAPSPNCTLPTGFTGTWPLAVPTDGTTTTTLYSADAGSGIGEVAIGDVTINGNTSTGNPFAWWVHLPATAKATTYTSTVTVGIATGP